MVSNTKSEIMQVFRELIRTLVSVIEHKDTFLKGHSERVSANCVLFSRKLSMPKEFTDAIYIAGLLYDIGMVYIPMEVIHKPDKLTPEEMELVKEHPKIAEKIMQHLSLFKNILPIIRHHHEAYDGGGYPDGLSGEQIPIGARIIAIADSYDAMTSERPHRAALSPTDALEQLRQRGGNTFDPRLVEEFNRFIISRKESVPAASESAPASEEGAKRNENIISGAVRDVVEAFKKGRIELPVFPIVIQKIQEVIKSPDCTLDDVARFIEQDQVLTLRLLSVANSAQYGGLGKIQTIKHAVARIGIKETQNIVSAIAMKSMFVTDDVQVKNMMEKLWIHTIATASLASAIGRKSNEKDPDMLFILGLTHDVGKVLLLYALTMIFSKKRETQTLNVEYVMQRIQGIHASFGGALLQRWGFPEPMINAVAAHEAPEIASHTPKVILILFLANILTRRIGYSLFTDEPPEVNHVVELLGLDEGWISTMLTEETATVQAIIDSL